jgi:uncharacterized membrane-anchored protein
MNDKLSVKPRRTRLLLILTLLQVLFLGGIAVSYYAVGWYGNEIKLKTVPVDPRDFLYGDYVTLSYEISQLPPSLWKGEGKLPAYGSVVYVLLEPVNGLYQAAGLYDRKPSASAGQAVLKGRVSSSWDDEIRVNYGLEQYYVVEGSGKELEQKAKNMIVTVKIGSWGQSRIVGLE